MPGPTADDTLTPAQREELQRLLAADHGATTSRALAALGLGPAKREALVRHAVLLRVGRGALVDAAAYALAPPREQHLLRAVAIARTWPAGVAISHISATPLLDLPLPIQPPERVHGCRMSTGQHRRNSVYTIHTGYAGAAFTHLYGVDVLEPRFTIMGVAEQLGRDAAVMAADAALQRAIDLADGRTESPGETRSRLLLLGLGFTPIPQVEIRDVDGDFIGRVDFLLEGTRVIVEFDGMTKYGSHEDLVAEKRRELRLQRAGYVVVRLVWADLAHPDRVRHLLNGALAAAA